jgi:uncharacterized protein
MADVQSVAEMLRVMVCLMVDNPDEVSIETIMDGPTVSYRVTVAPTDVDKVIGQGGRTARSLRVILQAVAMKQKLKINLDLG